MTEFFENKEESTKRLLDARKGRPVFPDKKEREEFLSRGRTLREKIKAFRLKHKIEDPPELARYRSKEVTTYFYKYLWEILLNWTIKTE